LKLGRAALASLLCVAGCRSIIGITVLEVDDEHDSGAQPGPDATAGADGQSDAFEALDTSNLSDSLDAVPPPEPDTSPPQPDAAAEIAACVAQEAGCVPCCQGLPSFRKFEQYAIDSGCLCGPCASANYCESTVCATPSTPSGGGPCDCCVDTLLLRPACGPAASACANDPACTVAAKCFGACGQSSYSCPGAPQ
jgi:hypothetical protein